MKTPRRTFVKNSGLAATAFTLLPALSFSQAPNSKTDVDGILKRLTEINDDLVEGLLAKQVDLPGDRWHGGVVDVYQLVNTHATVWFFIRLANSYASPHSRYHLSEKLEVPMGRAITCLLNVQHEDGTIDLHSTNFHSTPDTAFLVNYISPVYVVLNRLDRSELVGAVENLKRFLRNSGKHLAVGGIHTPNHRWVVCSALARIHSFFPSQHYVDRIEDWLGEGIDMDSDGQYTEHSVGVYSPTCDDMFITIGRLHNRPELLDVARKNLDMSLYYIQPGGEVLTDASGRQDNAQTGYVHGYYYAYRYFALKDRNPVYAAVCRLIENQMPERITRYISEFLETPDLLKELPKATSIPTDYFRRFPHSGVFRIRRGETDLSVIERNPTFMSFMKGTAVLQSVRLAAAFFGSRGQFISEDATVVDETIALTKSETHGYFQPFPESRRTGDGDMEKMPRALRTMSEVQQLDYRVEISESEGVARVDIRIEGTPHVPVSLEMSFRPGGELKGVIADKNLEGASFLEKGMGQYVHGKDTIKFGPGLAEHKWAEIRGMLPKQNGESVYLTGYTPFKHTLYLK